MDVVLANAQRAFNEWTKLPKEERKATDLMSRLDIDFSILLDNVTIARSRKHITKYYDTSEIGTFPTRLKPISYYCDIARKEDTLAYNDIFNTLMGLNMGVYAPMNYILPSRISKYEAMYDTKVGKATLKQVNREKALQRLMTINMLKRLESCVDSFRITLRNICEVNKQTYESILEYEKGQTKSKTMEFSQIDEETLDDEDFDITNDGTLGKVKIDFADMDLLLWKRDLKSDIDTLEELYGLMGFVTPDKDLKLQKLVEVIENKVNNPFNDGNKKILIFSAFADTTNYLYAQLSPMLLNIPEDYDVGFANARIELNSNQLLENIRNIQSLSNIKESQSLSHKFGVVDIDVEMETGTGKTYVYIKSMFELNKQYGFSKFIVVVPSIAIREGVKKSFEMTQEHFMDTYGKKARFFIYNSKKLDEIEQFSSSSAINVMIINIQAFNARGADARRIYEELDDFQSRRPIDVIARNRPIIILDEPQKMGGEATQESLTRFNPLFSMNFSATHKTQHNLVYVLDAFDAFNKKLVKKIQVKGFTVKNLRGTNGYLYLQDIILSPSKPPMARMEIEIRYKSGKTNRETRIIKIGDNLYQMSNEMEQYKNGFVVNEINPFNNTVTFINGNVLELGKAAGEVSEMDIRRIQIRETIRSHFEKEEELYERGIKVLSLFFIDEVAKYRQYDESGDEINGVYGDIFEEEYNKVVSEYITLLDAPYVRYLQSTSAQKAHNGYFSIDKKGRKIDSSIARGSDISDDVSAYDLILKDKERLLSFDEPTRFIFSHSALREGWDNPNVFQICTLKHSSSNVQRRQEVGRGLRLCVNSSGERMDATIPNFDVHALNMLKQVNSMFAVQC